MIKNLKFNSLGTIDCELEHPTYGWIPFTASPDDTEELGRSVYTTAMAGEYGAIEPYVAPEPVAPVPPSVVSMRQARRALLEKSLLASVQPVIDSLPSPSKEAAQIDWEYAQEVKRNDPLVQALALVLSLTEQDLDELFTLAAKF